MFIAPLSFSLIARFFFFSPRTTLLVLLVLDEPPLLLPPHALHTRRRGKLSDNYMGEAGPTPGDVFFILPISDVNRSRI